MSKRRATDELYGDSAKRTDQTGRGAEFTAHLRALNSQFAQWAQQQAAQAGDQLWLSGVKEYIKHADKLLQQYDDVLVDGNQHRSSSPLASNLFGTPAPAANGSAAAAAADEAAGAATGRSTGFGGGGGRKSVTFAEQPNSGAAGGSAAAATPGFGSAAVAATPGTANTANAGHTPAPASGLGFSFGATPGATPAAKGGELPSPEPFKLSGSVTPSSIGGMTPGPSPSTGGFSFGAAPTPAAGGSSGGFGFTPAGAAAAAAAAGATPAAGSGKFSFGVSSGGTAAGQDAAAAGASSSSGAGFGFGAAPAAAAGSTGGPAATTFSFGALPSSSAGAAAAGDAAAGSSPAFGFATTAAAGSGTAGGGLFKFPAPTAGGASDAAAGGADGDADEEAPAKFTPEIKVDEEKWHVLFNNKARLHVRLPKGSGGGDWEGRGVGMVTLRQPKEGDRLGRACVMFSTEVGKQLVSSNLYVTSVVHSIANKPNKCSILLMVPQYELPPAGAKADAAAAAASKTKHAMTACMFTFGSAEKVQDFKQLVEQYKPKK
ncbi:hypothetical protein OEZ85_008274 [Tetradesmus obliquus]|uniref:RanBD1 domain-containing protein n=1 Tax=Tetradesmus obliquus TaxID=3088 RepID=A0ABY8TN08_TETOB|nr:hypothetical protein OEZ85_008274 [Tetradesmus obliquus]